IPGSPPESCPKHAQPGHPYCSYHTGPMPGDRPGSVAEYLHEWRESARSAYHHLTSGETKRDEHDPELVRALLPLALPIYSVYWRVETFGIENVPTEGPGLLVANHSGTLPIDGAMLKVAVLKEHGRNPWLLAADLAFTIPGFRDIIRMAGNARADREETVRLMREGELLGVFPEGFKGIGKGWKNRYQLQRFGRGGFIEVCMQTGAPIIPVAIIGAEEAWPMLGNLEFLARRLRLPYFPVVPNLIPLPSKWIIAFGEPIPMIQHGPKAADDMQLVLELTEQIRQSVQDLIVEYLPKRRSAFL
ncbi:MAG: lysophospholipid acyltransferase family protein, partial [Actinomycetota bacterium]